MFRNFAIRNLAVIVFSILLAGTVLAPQALANPGNKEMLLALRHPVATPNCVLTPGRYDLKLLHTGGEVAGLWSANGREFYGWMSTTPVSRVHRINQARVVLSRPYDGIARIKEWFYPGDDYGYRFVYPGVQKQLAKEGTPAKGSNG